MSLLVTEHSLDFDNSNDIVVIGIVPELSFERTDSFSISAWIKTTSFGFEPIIGNLQPATLFRGWEVAVFQGLIRFELISVNPSNALIIISNTRVDDGNWHYVTCTYDGSSSPTGVNIYIDKALPSQTISTNGLTDTTVSTSPTWIGARQAFQQAYVGRITEVSVFNKELSAAEASTIYNNGFPSDLTVVGPTANLIGYWRLGEHEYPTVPDLSPSGNDGTMTNMNVGDIVIDAPRPHESYYSLLFGSDSEYVTIPSFANVNFDYNTPYTISFWFKAGPSSTSGYLYSKLNGSQGYGILMFADGYMQLVMSDSTPRIEVDTDRSYDDGQWHHFVATFGASAAASVTLYVDGEVSPSTIGADTLGSNSIANTGPINFNGSFNGTLLRGNFSICEVAIWSSEIGISDVQNLYNNGRPIDARTIGISTSLKAYWPITDSFPTITNFITNNNGTATNMESSDVKLDSPCLDFTSTTISTKCIEWESSNIPGWVDLGTSLTFDNTDAFSISAWVKFTYGGTIVSNVQTDSTFRGFNFFIDPDFGDFDLYMGSNSGVGNELFVYTDNRYDDDLWHHVCLVYFGDSDATTILIYVDGVSVPLTVDTDNLSGTIISTENLKIGKNAPLSTSYQGQIDDVAIYSRAITEVEVRTIYSLRTPNDITETMPVANLEGCWRMGDGYNFPIVPDVSGNGFTGIMSGYLHDHNIVNERPPGAPSTQFSIGNGITTRYDATSTLFDFGRDNPFSLVMTFRTDSNTAYFPTLASHQASIGYVVEISGNVSENDGGVRFRLIGSTGEIRAVTNDGYNDAQWYHLVITYDGSGTSSGITFYVNGNVAPHTVFEDTLGAEDFELATPYRIYDAVIEGGGYIGNTCQHAVYGIELSQSNVDDIYGSGSLPDLTSVGPTGNLIAYYPVLQDDLASLPNLPDYGPNDITIVSFSQYGSIIDDAPSALIPESSLVLNGIDGYISIGDVSALSFERTDPFTISVWVNMTSGVTTAMALVGKQEPSGNFRGWVLSVDSSNQLNFLLTSTDSNEIFVRSTNPIIRDDTWRSYCVTYDGSSSANGVRIFEDGFELELTIVENTLTTTTITTSGAAIGSSNSTGDILFDGYLDNVAIYNRTLSPNEVFNLIGFKTPRDHGAYGPVDSLIGWWRLGESQDDNSPINQNNGTLQNMDSSNISSDIPLLDRYNKMRGLDAGNSYVTWITQNINPDFEGSQAPVSVVGGTVAQIASWSEDVKVYKMRGLQSGGPPVVWLSGGKPDWDAEIPKETIIGGSVVVLGILPFNIKVPRIGE